MSTATRVPLAEAEIVAHDLVTALGLGCHRIAVAGSIRRKAPTVGDIEIVAVPRTHTERVREGLFEDADIEVDELQVCVDSLLMDGTLSNHPIKPARGPRYAKLLHTDSGMQVDLFSTSAERFGLIYLIRTGPASYSQWVVTEARARGFHVIEGELHRGRMGCAAIPCAIVPTPDEDAVFRALHIHPAGPESRA